MRNRYPRKTLLINTFGTFGYISCLFQWLWAVVVFLPSFIESDAGTWVVPQHTQQSAPMFTIEQPPVALTIAVIVITILVLVATVVALLRLPAQVAKTGKKITQAPAEALVPVITHHKKISEKKRLQLSAQIIRIIKLCLCLIPFVIAALAFLVELRIAYEIVVIIAAGMAGISLMWFALQNILARIWKIPEGAVV